MEAATHKYAGTDTLADGDEHKILLSLRCSAIVFALRRQVRIIFDNHTAFELAGEHGSQSDITPVLQRAECHHDPLVDIDDGGHSYNEPQQLIFRLLVFSQQLADFFADPCADCQ